MPIWGQVELLCRAVSEEGRSEAEKVLSRARAEAERTLMQALEIAEKDAASEDLQRRSRAHAEARRIVDSAELEARKRMMAFREQVAREVLEALKERLEAFRMGPSYEDFLFTAMIEGIEHLSGSSFIAELGAEDLERVATRAEQWAEEHELHVELRSSPAMGGGVRIFTGDGRRLYDNSLPARLKRSEADIRQEIWRSLFGAERKSD